MLSGLERNKRYYWLKLPEDFFRQKEIKQLRKIAGGDTFTIIYLKMLLRSLKDDGKLYYDGVESDFASELALDIDEDEENVRMTVAFLVSKNLLMQSQPDEYELVASKMMTGSEGYSAERMRRLRVKSLLASQSDGAASQSDSDVTLSDGDVTASDEEIEKEIEIREKRESHTSRKSAEIDVSPCFKDFWTLYPRKVSKQMAIRAWKKQGIEDSQSLIDTIMADVKRRIASEWKDKDVQFIPHPSTYLNQRRWEDEITTVSQPAQPDYSYVGSPNYDPSKPLY